MTVVPASAFESNVLDVQKHARMALDIDRYAERAGIDPKYIWTTAVGVLPDDVIAYLRKCRVMAKGGTPGAFLAGSLDPTPTMSAMAGALVRAFVDARVLTLKGMQIELDEAGYIDATVLMIPNAYSASEIGKFDERKIAALGDVLSQRVARCQPTVLGLENYKAAVERLGLRIGSIIAHMIKLGV